MHVRQNVPPGVKFSSTHLDLSEKLCESKEKCLTQQHNDPVQGSRSVHVLLHTNH